MLLTSIVSHTQDSLLLFELHFFRLIFAIINYNLQSGLWKCSTMMKKKTPKPFKGYVLWARYYVAWTYWNFVTSPITSEKKWSFILVWCRYFFLKTTPIMDFNTVDLRALLINIIIQSATFLQSEMIDLTMCQHACTSINANKWTVFFFGLCYDNILFFVGDQR